MKILIIALAFLNGGYMLLDGVFVMLNGKYIGPHRPGPWADLFYKLNINVFELGPMFIVFGLFWLIWLYMFLAKKKHAFKYGITICILTLWYLPIGTLFSIIILISLFDSRKKFGI